MAEFRMPSLGADMDEGTLVSWLVGVGDHVERGQVVAEVDTEKSVIEVETFDTGTVSELLVHEGERVPVGTPLAVIAEGVGAAQPRRRAVPTRTRPGTRATTTEAAAKPATKPAAVPLVRGAARVAASPLARRHAAALGVDLATVTGTGPGGAVTTSDVETAAHPVRPALTVEPEPAPVVDEPAPVAPVVPRSGADRQASMRHAVAEAMARSKREIPHYYLAADVDMAHATRWLEAHNTSVPVTERVLVAALQLKATALALRAVPELNGHWVDGEHRPAEHVHLGVAIALRGGGLVAPAVHDADRLALPEMMAALHDLVARVRAGKVRSSEYADPTATVTNLGDQGVDVAYPVINPPQLAMVAFGRVRERPWAVDGMLAVRPVLTVTLAADHRATDGRRGATFLAALDDLLQRPNDL
ncbi:dihydrolipoamide acetyltransferase family protein [Isoptericola sp. b441]|uniref:Dihydrolipoamide acetyltransferase component of pyruvate dehydrogenase complex n=1 Tax=Actinotalea lenta TaxID=3064654 RepID=A0ABT9D9V7_9CELL|nr:dihydrolipoamide acetyltransferase family protein [Isoptericola sp. b441]MDO8107049.1 dihydrolipoamide acetyltransferase family protein [Isoptericola sp. b441]